MTLADFGAHAIDFRIAALCDEVAFMNSYRRGLKLKTETSLREPTAGAAAGRHRLRSSAVGIRPLHARPAEVLPPGAPARKIIPRLQFVPVGFDAALNAFLQMSVDMKVAI
jgi:hypothetical protein